MKTASSLQFSSKCMEVTVWRMRSFRVPQRILHCRKSAVAMALPIHKNHVKTLSIRICDPAISIRMIRIHCFSIFHDAPINFDLAQNTSHANTLSSVHFTLTGANDSSLWCGSVQRKLSKTMVDSSRRGLVTTTRYTTVGKKKNRLVSTNRNSNFPAGTAPSIRSETKHKRRSAVDTLPPHCTRELY